MKLGKLKMPSKKAGEDLSSRLFAEESEAEAGDEDFANELAGESEGEDADAPELDEMGAEMEAISDDDLMAEVKRRGLSSKLDASSSPKKSKKSPFPEEPAEEDSEY